MPRFETAKMNKIKELTVAIKYLLATLNSA